MTYTAVDMVLACALGSEGAQETPVGSNAGPFVERVLRTTGNKVGDPWCAAFVATVGTTALGAAWPLPKTASCQALADYAAHHGGLVATPQRGDVFLIWHPTLKPPRFAHAGFVLDPASSATVSGNTTAAGAAANAAQAREGWTVARKPWKFKPEDRFIRWSLLLPHAPEATP